jgi:hypothetical protein
MPIDATPRFAPWVDDPDEYIPMTREQMERAAENVARFMGVAGEQAQDALNPQPSATLKGWEAAFRALGSIRQRRTP